MSVDLVLSLFFVQRIDFLEIIAQSCRNIYLIIFFGLIVSFSVFGRLIRNVIKI